MSSLLCAMGDESETIMKTFALTDIEHNDVDTVMSNVYTDTEDRLVAGFGLMYKFRHEIDVATIFHALPQFVREQCLHLAALVRDLCDADTYYCGTIHNISSCLLAQMSMVRLQQDKSEELDGDREIVLSM